MLLEALKAQEAAGHTIHRILMYLDLMNDVGEDNPDWLDFYVLQPVFLHDIFTDFWEPELLAIEDDKIQAWIQDKAFDDYRVYIQQLLHKKPHILSEKEDIDLPESQTELPQGTSKSEVISFLCDEDMERGTVHVDGKELPLTFRNYDDLIKSPDRSVRQEAYRTLYAHYASHADRLPPITPLW